VVDGVEVRLEDPEGAPRYLIAVIRGVRVGPSPAWLADRLTAVGQRPINNVVDATNYILFELNQPLHAFDLAKLRGPAVAVRRAIELIIAVAGGEVRAPALDLWPQPQQERTIFLRPERVSRLLGVTIERPEVERLLTAVGFFVAPKDGRLAVQVPGWRPDVTR